MTKSTITRERAQQIFLGNGPEPSASEERELARMALAAMDSEPVAYSLIFRNMDGVLNNYINTNTTFSTREKAEAYGKGGSYEMRSDGRLEWVPNTALDPVVVPLYRHAQPAPVVPVGLEHLRSIVADPRLLPRRKEWIGGQQFSYVLLEEVEAIVDEACRAAMLAAAQQSPGSEPATVPGKWIPVSERMPVEFEAVIAFDGDQVYGEAMYSSGDGFTIDGYDPCDRVQLQSVTHWMPLPAAPQEVK